MRERATAAAATVLLTADVIRENPRRAISHPHMAYPILVMSVLVAVAIYLAGLAIIFGWIGEGVPAGS